MYHAVTGEEVTQHGGKHLTRCAVCSHAHWFGEPCRGCSGAAMRDYNRKHESVVPQQLPPP